MLTLHLTNGDLASSALARSGLPGDIVSWRDLLHDGPVPRDDDLEAFRRVRGHFLASRGWSHESDAVADFAQRDARLEVVGAGDEVVLWFEPDLYDQLQLIQILARFAGGGEEARPRLTIVPADCYLGPMEPARLATMYGVRREITAVDLLHGQLAWSAFTAPTPDALLAVVSRLDREVTARTYDADAQVRLPHLVSALRRQLEEYPDIDSGLSRSERQLCEALSPRAITLRALFAAHQAAESWVWLGDLSFAWYAERLSDCAQPIVEHTDGSRLIAPLRDARGQGFWERTVQLTPFGQDVVRARADAVRANGIDRWIGGTHSTLAQYWRWDARTQCTQPFPRS